MMLVIRENLNPPYDVYIDFCRDEYAAPHAREDYQNLAAAKAAYPIDWQEPDEDCDGTVLAWGYDDA